MEIPRPLHDHELPDFVRFLSAQLRPKNAWSIDEEYPLAIQTQNLHNVRVIRRESEFLSAAVMKPLVVKSPAGLFKAAAIGSVVTHPIARNQGLSRQILEASLSSACANGCDFAILWTNLYDFYRKLGFELAGTEIALRLPSQLKSPAPTESLRFMCSGQVDPDAILRLYSQHTTGSVRTTEDIRKFLRIPNARVFTAWDAQNRLQAYAVEGKGADLEGYIHEWGGGVSKLLPLLEYVCQQKPVKPLTLIAPVHAANMIRQLVEAGATRHAGVLGMIKLLNPNHFLMKIKKYAHAMGASEIIIEPRDGMFYLGSGETLFSTDSEADLVKLVFGPNRASELHGFDPKTAEAFDRVFPIPMWIWGWDSV